MAAPALCPMKVHLGDLRGSRRRFAELFLIKFIKWKENLFQNQFGRCRGNTWTMREFHDSNGNGFEDISWTDKLHYFSSIVGPCRRLAI